MDSGQREFEILRLLVVEDRKLTYDYLIHRLYCTSPSIKLALDNLNGYLEGNQVMIESDRTGTRLNGEELAIQKAFKKIIIGFVEKNVGVHQSHWQYLVEFSRRQFNTVIVDYCLAEVERLSDKNNRLLNDYYLASLYVTLLVLVIRASKDKHLTGPIVPVKAIDYLEDYLLAEGIRQATVNQLNVILTVDDVDYLASQLYGHGIRPSIRQKVVPLDITIVVEQMIADFSKVLKVDLSKDCQLRSSLISHMAPMIYRLQEKIYIRNQLLDYIKKEYHVLFSLTWYIASKLEHHFSINLTDDEVSFLTIYIQVALNKVQPPKKILIVCSYGLATAQLLYDKVEKLASAKDNITIVSAKEFIDYDLGSIDLIISSVKLSKEDGPIIYVSPILKEDEVQTIKRFLERLDKRYRLLDNGWTGKQSLVSRYLRRENIHLQQAFKSKQQCLEFIIDGYEAAGTVKQGFRESIFEREKLGTTVIVEGVAMPHADPSTIIRTSISLVTCRPEIVWDKVKVALVIFVAAAEMDVANIKEVISGIHRIVDNPKAIDKIRQAVSVEQIDKVFDECRTVEV